MDLGFEVVHLDDPDVPGEGEPAPDFERPLVDDEFWEDVALSELTAAGPVLLLFHPMDGAFPATYIWNELRDREIDAFACTVVGLSISTPYEHASFIRDRDLADTDIRLFSDPSNEVARTYGVTNALDGMAGVEEARPAAFVIDGERTVQYSWAATEWPEFPDYDELEAAVEAVADPAE